MDSKRRRYFVGRFVAVTLILASSAWAANKEEILYTFTGGNDGGDPAAQLIFDSSGNAYGTTVVGGTSNFGTVFKLTPHANGKWTETVLYSFLGEATTERILTAVSPSMPKETYTARRFRAVGKGSATAMVAERFSS